MSGDRQFLSLKKLSDFDRAITYDIALQCRHETYAFLILIFSCIKCLHHSVLLIFNVEYKYVR